MKQNLTELKGKKQTTIIAGYFNIALSTMIKQLDGRSLKK